ncbi:MAG: WD40 repeat domain-containing protein [Planctomycetes bacterium]|nr:WD40 repeat domain-containing protein [Planctomycetota bacterium]
MIYGTFDPQGGRFGLCTPRGLEIRSADDGSLIGSHRDDQTWIWYFAWSRDGSQLAACDAVGTIRVWRDDEVRPLELTGHLGSVAWVDFSAGGDSLFSASREGRVRRWRLTDPIGAQCQVRGEGMVDVARVRDRILVATGHGEVLVCDLDGQVLTRCELDPDWTSIGVAPDGSRVAIASLGGEIWTWDPDGPEPPRLEHSSEWLLSGCGILADGRILVCSAFSGAALILEHGQLERIPDAKRVTSMAVSADGARVVFGDRQGSWWLAHLRDGVLVRDVARSAVTGQSIFGLTFSPDGSRVLVSSASGGVVVCEVASGRELYRATDHRASVMMAGFAPDGRRIATPSFDGTVRVVDLDRPDRPLVLGAWGRGAFFKALWIDANRLLTAGSAGVHWWSVDGRDVWRAVESIPIEDLTPAEEDRYRTLLGR